MSDLSKIVRHNASSEYTLTMIDEATDVAAGVADNAASSLLAAVGECVACLPVGSIIKALGNSYMAFSTCRFFQKLGKFLCAVKGNSSKEEIDAFLDSITDRDEDVSEYMLSVLDKAESKEKARMMGIIYAAAARGMIDIDTMLRLCSIVERGFVADFRRLPEFTTPHDDVSDASNTFVNLGLIDNEPGGIWRNQSHIEMNTLGNTLLNVLRSGNWFE